jgi:acyl carrier protein
MNDIKGTIRQFILTNYLPDEAPGNLRDVTRLQSSGILDSLAVLDVARFVEREFAIELSAYDIGPDTFDRIEDIARLVARKQSGAQMCGGPSR